MTLPKDLPSSYHTVFGWGLDYGKEHGKDFVIGYKIHIIMFIEKYLNLTYIVD